MNVILYYLVVGVKKEWMESPVDLPMQESLDVQTLWRVWVHWELGGSERRAVLLVGAVVAVIHVVADL